MNIRVSIAPKPDEVWVNTLRYPDHAPIWLLCIGDRGRYGSLYPDNGVELRIANHAGPAVLDAIEAACAQIRAEMEHEAECLEGAHHAAEVPA